MPINQHLKDFSQQVRRDILRMVHKVNSGHPGGSLGCVEYFTCLFQKVLDHSTNFNIDGKNEDLFFLSNGHISPVYYSVLARSGYFPISELGSFRSINSRLQGHPATAEGLPGIRIASGSLGQGLSVGLGAAEAKKLNGDRKLVYTLSGDGELQEGQNWEAIMYASAKKIDNIIATIDLNGKQIDGSTDKVLQMGSLKAKFEAFDWKVLELKNGNDLDEVLETLQKAKKLTNKTKPVCILLHTTMGCGVDFMTNTHLWHGKAPNDKELEIALAQNPETLGDY